MTAHELKEILEDLESKGIDLDKVEVVCAYQPRYPKQMNVDAEVYDPVDDGDEEKGDPVLVIFEDGRDDYLEDKYRKMLGWGRN